MMPLITPVQVKTIGSGEAALLLAVQIAATPALSLGLINYTIGLTFDIVPMNSILMQPHV